MINLKQNPLEWSTLLYELEDAVEHLGDLVSQMSKNGEIDEVDYQVQIAHVYAHLNRSWNSRNLERDWNSKERVEFTKMPDDLDPVG